MNTSLQRSETCVNAVPCGYQMATRSVGVSGISQYNEFLQCGELFWLAILGIVVRLTLADSNTVLVAYY
jgi:hypothetical protein